MIKLFIKNILIFLTLLIVSCSKSDEKRIRIVDLQGKSHAIKTRVPELNVEILESQDIINDTQKAIQKKIENFGSISALINFNCILRTTELKEKKQTQAYGQLFKEIPTIGFSTYGESYIGHMNQIAIMLAFK